MFLYQYFGQTITFSGSKSFKKQYYDVLVSIKTVTKSMKADDMFSVMSVCHSVHIGGHMLTVLDLFKLVYLGHHPNPGPSPSPSPYSWDPLAPPIPWTCSNLFTWTHYEAHTIGKRAVGLKLKGLLVRIVTSGWRHTVWNMSLITTNHITKYCNSFVNFQDITVVYQQYVIKYFFKLIGQFPQEYNPCTSQAGRILFHNFMLHWHGEGVMFNVATSVNVSAQ